jgi:hypothetical protein
MMKDVKTMIKEEMEKYRDEDRQQEAGQCIMGEMRKDREDLSWKEKYDKEHKLRQEAETETILVKGIGMNSPEMREMKTKLSETEVILKGTKKIVQEGFNKIDQLQKELDRVKKENNDSFSRIAELCEVNERHQEINGKLQVMLTESEEENKRMHDRLDKRVDRMRKAGM